MNSREGYLDSSDHIDWQRPSVDTKATELASGCCDPEAVARRCFEFVRDEIRHSWDARDNPVTCRASEVLKYATGFCYAKSHLLAALLRANGIPAGLCYQRLRLEGGGFCLHGLNALYLEPYGWYRVDARGNTGEVAAQFAPPAEKLAFPVLAEGEVELPGIYAEPLPVVVEALESAADIYQLAGRLPDLVPAVVEGAIGSD